MLLILGIASSVLAASASLFSLWLCWQWRRRALDWARLAHYLAMDDAVYVRHLKAPEAAIAYVRRKVDETASDALCARLGPAGYERYLAALHDRATSR
jgi:hypothetical protein